MSHKFIFILLIFCGLSGFSQETQIYRFSLEEAVTFAIENNLKSKNAAADIEAARKKKWGSHRYWIASNQRKSRLSTLFKTTSYAYSCGIFRRTERRICRSHFRNEAKRKCFCHAFAIDFRWLLFGWFTKC
ncbi:exported hypothetical protein [Capnocytophaga canimorsus]|uniref:Uncharacterized protein n=1 Tax=Capnocytophaga canimorsus TaxID=28188 RepID=A0A0B7IKW4_9FLAO|nr:exported hypothetical protein [Capnocytophaga canimorsus]